MRAFTVKNFKFYDEDHDVMWKPLLHKEEEAKELGVVFDIQKNRRNGQETGMVAIPDFPDFNPVKAGLNVLSRADTLGSTEPDDPLCVYKEGDHVHYLTGKDITDYYRFVAQLVHPNISDAELKLISTHSLRVLATVLLCEAGKDGPYIKLRLRWLSDCYMVYLRNTNRITEQHADALAGVHATMAAIATVANEASTIVSIECIEDLDMDDLEDED